MIYIQVSMRYMICKYFTFTFFVWITLFRFCCVLYFHPYFQKACVVFSFYPLLLNLNFIPSYQLSILISVEITSVVSLS